VGRRRAGECQDIHRGRTSRAGPRRLGEAFCFRFDQPRPVHGVRVRRRNRAARPASTAPTLPARWVHPLRA